MKKSNYILCFILLFGNMFANAQTAEEIIKRYIEVTGGSQRLQSIKSYQTIKTGSTMMGDIEVIDEYEYPFGRKTYYYTNGQETYHFEFDGNSGYIINNSVTTQLTYQDITIQKCYNLFMPELYYKDYNYTVQYIGSRRINKYRATYDKVQFTDPNGNYFINYYDQATGYKCRTEYMDTSFEHFSEFENIDGMMVANEYLAQILLIKTRATLSDIAFAREDFVNAGALYSYGTNENFYDHEELANSIRGDDSDSEIASPPAKKQQTFNKPPEKKKNSSLINNVTTDDNATPATNTTANSSEGVYNKKLALIVGNSAYTASPLKNPVNDARAMSSTLKNLGFDVMYYDNVSQKEMKKAIDAFGQRLKGYEVGLFYYAGHGIQYKGRNYMIPVEADLKNEQQIEYDCIAADRVLAFMEYAESKVNIIVLDACRNNPFERSWNRSSNGSGLAFMNAPTGSMIAYATSPGNTASDGTGSNGLYTSALLKYMNTSGITIEQMFKRVRSEVEERSGGKQVPWESTSLKGEFYFSPSN